MSNTSQCNYIEDSWDMDYEEGEIIDEQIIHTDFHTDYSQKIIPRIANLKSVKSESETKKEMEKVEIVDTDFLKMKSRLTWVKPKSDSDEKSIKNDLPSEIEEEKQKWRKRNLPLKHIMKIWKKKNFRK